MHDLDFLPESETAPPDRPGFAWFAQAAGVFSASVCAVGALFALALTGGWATFDGGPTQSAASDLQPGQYYQEQWLNPDTGRPYAEQIDEVSIDYAELPAGEDDSGWAEPLEGEPPARGGPAFDPVGFSQEPVQGGIAPPVLLPGFKA